MNLIHAIRRPAGILLRLASVVLASLTAAMPAALAASRPRPPGWNKHPPPPAHPLATGGIPGWQLALMTLTVVLLAAVLVSIAYPGPGRPAAAERAHRPADDRQPRYADPHDQPAALPTPAGARQNHRPGPRP
jgi:hypothetical protein